MEGGEGNAKRGCGRWMEDCGRGAAVEQLTARGMEEYQSPQWGAIAEFELLDAYAKLSIPAMGAIGCNCGGRSKNRISIPAIGGNRTTHGTLNEQDGYQSPRWGAIVVVVR